MIKVKLAVKTDLDVDQAVTAAKADAAAETAEAAARLKQALRDQVTGAGLGDRLANTWRSHVAKTETGAQATVTSSAPVILTAFDQGATIVAKNGGRWLAIPTDAVPKRWRGGRMSPVEVEAQFNRDLRYIPPRAGRNGYLVMDAIVPARSGRGFRSATAGRLAQGRQAQSILMFVLVPQVTLTKRLDVARVLAETAAAFPDLTVTALS